MYKSTSKLCIIRERVYVIFFSTNKLKQMRLESLTLFGIKTPENIAVISSDNIDSYELSIS